MKFYISYWSNAKKYPNKKILNYERKKIVNQVEKCLFLLSKNYKDINLITDEKGAKFLSNNKWNKVYTDLENITTRYSEVWSLGKLYAINLISKKQEPFIHLDYDFFIYKPIDKNILESNILVQSIESLEYGYNIKKFSELCEKKYYGENIKSDFAYNCGIVGGSDTEFFKLYSESAMKLVLDKNNEKFWLNPEINKKYWTKAVLAEQYYLSLCLHYFNKKFNLFFDNSITLKKYDPTEKDFYFKTGAVHLYGEYRYIAKNKYKYLMDKFI